MAWHWHPESSPLKIAQTSVCHIERKRGHVSTAFLDDSLLLAETEMPCAKNVRDTVKLIITVARIHCPPRQVGF